MQNNPRLLLIDDDQLPTEYYINALQRDGWRVLHRRSPDTAIRALQNAGSGFNLIVLDLMMPSGKAFSPKETDDGAKTGMLLYRRIRELCGNVPIIVLTNATSSDRLGPLRHLTLVAIESKLRCTPLELVKRAAKFKSFMEKS